MDNHAPAILQALQRISGRRSNLNVKSFKGYSQDPGAWLREYQQAALASGWDVNTMLEAAPAYLKDAASHWYQSLSQGQILRWDVTVLHPQRNAAFKTALVDQFRMAAQERQWQAELDRRTQKKEESVEQYASSLQSLIKKVDPNGVVPEGIRIQWFLRSLQPSLQVQNYLPCRDNVTLQGVITAACQYEQGQTAHLQSLVRSEVTPAAPAVVATVVQEDPMKELVKQMTDLLQPIATAINQLQQQVNTNQTNARQHYQSRASANPTGQPWRYRQQQGPFTCHRCGQYGHVARVCPNLLAPQAPVPQPIAPQPPVSPTTVAQQPPAQPATALPMFTTPTQTSVQPPASPTNTQTTIRFDSPGQAPQLGSVNFAKDDQSLNW